MRIVEEAAPELIERFGSWFGPDICANDGKKKRGGTKSHKSEQGLRKTTRRELTNEDARISQRQVSLGLCWRLAKRLDLPDLRIELRGKCIEQMAMGVDFLGVLLLDAARA
jgi:hypothetical protein